MKGDELKLYNFCNTQCFCIYLNISCLLITIMLNVVVRDYVRFFYTRMFYTCLLLSSWWNAMYNFNSGFLCVWGVWKASLNYVYRVNRILELQFFFCYVLKYRMYQRSEKYVIKINQLWKHDFSFLCNYVYVLNRLNANISNSYRQK